jgi:hypothetical protein
LAKIGAGPGSISSRGHALSRSLAIGAAASLVLAAVVGCGGGHPYEPGRQAVVHVEIGAWNPGETVAPSQGWPWPQMSDIPPFPGTLDPSSYRYGQVTVGSSGRAGYTLYFNGVTYKQFQAYAMLLRAAGYRLQGDVYYNSDEDAARARGAAGQIDQLVATKDPRALRIWAPSPPSGSVRFDISGLSQEEVDAIPTQSLARNVGVGPNGETYIISAPPIPTQSVPAMSSMPAMPSSGASTAPGQWPAEWADLVPEPEDCVIDPHGITVVSAESMYVVCVFPDGDVGKHQDMIKAYVVQLTAAGFTLVSETKSATVPDGLSVVTLSKGSVSVTISDTEPTGMTIVGVRH